MCFSVLPSDAGSVGVCQEHGGILDVSASFLTVSSSKYGTPPPQLGDTGVYQVKLYVRPVPLDRRSPVSHLDESSKHHQMDQDGRIQAGEGSVDQ